MQFSTNSRLYKRSSQATASALSAIAILLLAGCGNYIAKTPQADPDYIPEPNAKIELQQGQASSYDMSAQDPHTDPLAERTDPLMRGAHPFSSDTNGFGGGHSRLAGGDPLSTIGHTDGWYWINGAIDSGSIAIEVNGVPIGRYAIHIDTEITKYCHPGLNTLTFTHYPLALDHSTLCPVRLKILNGHAPAGSPPVTTYDTSSEVESQKFAASQADQSAASLFSPSTPTSTSPSSDTSSSPLPVAPDTASSPTTETLTFTAK